MTNMTKEELLAQMNDDDATAAQIASFTEDGVSTEVPTIQETTIKASLKELSLEFGLSKSYLENPDTWKPTNPKYPDSFMYSRVCVQFECLSAAVKDQLKRDTNPIFRVNSMESRKLDFKILPTGLDLTNRNLVSFLGSLLEQFGYATRIEGTFNYVFAKEFLADLNNGVSALKASLTEKVLADEPLHAEAVKNDFRLLPFFIAELQLSNLNTLLQQREESLKLFGVVIGRCPRRDDATRNENYVKDFAHSGTESGSKLLEFAAA